MGSMARWFLLLLTGCSLTLSGPDPNRPRSKAPVCDTSKSLVALDGVMAATMAVVGVAAAGSSNSSSAVVPALLSALFIGSAIHGNNVVNDCHREMENYDSAMAARDIEPPVRPPLGPPLGPPGMAAPQAPVAPQPEAPAAADEPGPPPAQAPTPPPPPPAANDRWSAFWREVP